MTDLRIVDAPVLLQESITDDVKMPTGGLGNFSVRLGDILWYVITKEQLANKNYVDLSSKNVKDSLDEHIADKNNSHQVTKAQVGLGSVDNTADIDKPVSNATKSAIITATTDMATKAYVNQKDNLKADKATTLSGYGITDAYTKDETYSRVEINSTLTLKSDVAYVDGKDGDLTTLKTTDKTNLVKAVNEIHDVTKGVVALYDRNVEAGAGANGWTAELIVDGDKTQKQINNFFKSKKLIDTRLYGVVANTTADQTAAIHAAFAANPTNNNFYIPTGVVKANIVYPRAYINLVGDSMLKTILQPFDLTKPAVSFNKFLYPSLTQLSVQAGQDYTSEQLIDARDSRYIYMSEVDTKKTIKSGETHSYQTILIDNRSPNVGWTGYNTFDNVRCTYGSYGYLSDTDKLNSVISMKSCVFAGNGYFGIKTAAHNGTFLSMDIAGNGKLCPSGTYDETMYGGVYLSGANTAILAAWHEENQHSTINYSENSLYIHPDSSNIVHNFGRNTRSNVNARVFTQSQGQLINVSTADRATDDGLGRARNYQLCKNGTFLHINSATTRPKGWLGTFIGTWSQETSDLPTGYATGFKFVSSAAGANNLYQKVYDSTDINNSLIKDISKWVGREVTVSFWVKNIGTSTSSIRGGITTDTRAYFIDGNYSSVTEIGVWRKFIVSRKITGTETFIAFGLRVAGVGESFIVTGFSFADDCRVLDSQAKPITEDGGEIYGSLSVDGKITQSGQALINSPVQLGNNGLLSAATAINTTDKYIGKQVFNTSNSLMYYATGTTPISPWKSFDSTNTITPV